VDDAPGIVWVFKLGLLLGGSLPVLRLLAALCGVATVVSASLMARELGGGRRAQAFAGVCVLAAPIFMSMHGILCVGDLEPLAWVGCALLLARIARTGDSRLWLAFGAVAGLGIQIKYTMLLVLACFLGAMLLTRLRGEMRRLHFWAGAALALLIAAPTFAWQVRNHFPLLTDMENIRATGKNVVLGPWPFLKQQILFMNPLLLPVVAGGLAWLFSRRESRVLGWFYGILLGAMFAIHGKDYYLAAVYPLLYAAGAVALERLLESGDFSRGRLWPWIALAAPACGLILLAAPTLLPILTPERHVAYQERLGGKGQKA
jgi:4-amino-4-deoxy-L-arabinose transferase-like glycosyltransferase